MRAPTAQAAATTRPGSGHSGRPEAAPPS
jgi:hypothetical protein